MDSPDFPHNFDFDPRYGYDLDTLCKLDAPLAPDDFAAFWQGLCDAALAVQPQPVSREVPSPVADLRLFEIEFTSLDFCRIGGWLTLPQSGPVTRGVVVGHGYGGRDGADLSLAMRQAAAIFPCARGISRSAHPLVPGDPSRHVLYGIHSRRSYVLAGCAADTVWCAASALQVLVPATLARLDYMGISFGGGIGALALPWDERFASGHLNVPTFGNHPLRLTMPCVGSEAVKRSATTTATAATCSRFCVTSTLPALPATCTFRCSWRRLCSIPPCHHPVSSRSAMPLPVPSDCSSCKPASTTIHARRPRIADCTPR